MKSNRKLQIEFLNECKKLQKISMECSVGAITIEGTRIRSKTQTITEQTSFEQLQHQIILWEKHEQWIRTQIEDYQIAIERYRLIELENEQIESKLETIEEIEQSIGDLQEKLRELSLKRNNDCLLLQRLKETQMTLNVVYPQSQLTIQQEQLRLLLIHRDRKITELSLIIDQLRKTTEELESIQKESFDIREENKRIWKEINEQSIETNQQSNIKDQQKLENLKIRIEILRNVLKLLIFETGINWAEDEELMNIIMDKDSFEIIEN